MNPPPENPTRLSAYQRLKAFLDREWPAIRVAGILIALLTLWATARSTGSSARQTDLLATQVAKQLSQPVFDARAMYETGNRQGLETLRDDMVNEFMDHLLELSSSNPNVPYHQLIKRVAPITRNVPPASVIVTVSVKNTGNVSATGVALSVDWIGEITDVSVDALSQWKVVDGGIAAKAVVISIDRISPSETATLSVEYAPTKDATDTVELSLDHPNAVPAWLVSYTSSANEPQLLPTFAIIPGKFTPSYDLIRVRVASTETPMQGIPVLPGDFIKQFQKLLDAKIKP